MKPLTAADLIIGNKYVPHTKSVWGTLEESKDWRNAKAANQLYLYYRGTHGNNHCFARLKNTGEDLFLPSDVTPYVEVEQAAKEGKKQTAVEWLVEQLLFKDHSNPLIQQALQMEREQIDASKVTRVEVIQHSKPYNGRAYNAKDVEIQFQDNGRTLKIFLK